MPFITQGKTNFPYLLIIVALAIIAGGFILCYYYLWIIDIESRLVDIEIKLPPKTIEDEIANWKTYRNDKYGHEIKYPPDWRIAYSIMEWHKKEASKRWCIEEVCYNDIEDWVMITNLSAEEEKEYLMELERVSSECDISTMCGTGALDYVYNADGRAITIFPNALTSEELEYLKNPKPQPGVEHFDFREEETKTGLKIIRLRQKITWEMDRDYERVFIPYSTGKISDSTINYIELNIERNEGNYEKDIFNQMLSTFRFIEVAEEFCGWSTNGSCSTDSDCMTGGCSDQVCQSKNEEPVITTCEWSDCYDETQYGLECRCVDNKCQWSE